MWLPQVVDGYTVTLSMAAAAPPGDGEVVVTIHDPAGRVVVGAEGLDALLAYIRAVSSNPNSATTPNQHVHTPGASATEGQGLIAVPARLNASAEAGACTAAWWHLRKKVPGRPSSDYDPGASTLCSSRSASSINARAWRCWADLRP